MAAYAALVSLMHIIDRIQNHPRPPITLDKIQVESLIEKVTFLQEFLEGYSHVSHSKEADALESRIADAAHAAEDIIESHMVDQILAGSTSHGEEISPGGEISSVDFCEGLRKVIEDMELIRKEVVEIKEKMGDRDQLPRSSTPAVSLRAASTGQNTMVGFDDVSLEIMDKLTSGELDRQIIPIVGMAGIGKTTLTANIYAKPFIKRHFDICGWATISQEYDTREILSELLGIGKQEIMGELSENELGEILYKRLSGRRYLMVLDDLWSIEAWDKIKFFFPNYNNGSRILVTTRLSELAFQLTDSYRVDMKFLDDEKSWDLFCKIVFGEEGCPPEQEEIGKKIVQKCKGLPLSIVVIGGLLTKSKHIQEYWEYIAENLNSVVNSEDNESCLKILHMSYNQLPVYLKPCFLYMGIFPEDYSIRVTAVIKLWVVEGFLRPISGKSLEEIAKEYLQELISRNLILVQSMGPTGNIKYCNIHDLLRDLCLREAQKERFYDITNQRNPNIFQGINSQRRIVIPHGTSEEKLRDVLRFSSTARSLICQDDLPEDKLLLKRTLLRILSMNDKFSHCLDKYTLENMLQLVNLRYLSVRTRKSSKLLSSVYLLWNLHTLMIQNTRTITAPVEIWKMPQLRHVEFKGGLYLPDPPNSNIDGEDDIVLGNLHTLKFVLNFKCDKEVVKRIPNIKKLEILYENDMGSTLYHLNNLEHLQQLESFFCSYDPTFMSSRSDLLQNLTLPNSLKKLSLNMHESINWEDTMGKIGSLPLLEKLALSQGSFKGCKWETVEGQFCSLKFLAIFKCRDLKYWTTESSHFPRLELLFLGQLYELEEIPSDIGEIPTLREIYLYKCGDPAAISAKRILDEQEESQGEVVIQVGLVLPRGERNEALERLASPNFQVRYEE